MIEKIFEILRNCHTDHELDQIAKLALDFIESSADKSIHSSEAGQPSRSIANIYRVRMKHKTFKPEAFVGLEQSINALGSRDITVRLSAIETDKGVVSVWLNESNKPVGIVIGRFF